jgi:hypothetical protein
MVIEDSDLSEDEIRIVVRPGQAERFAETTGPTAQSAIRHVGVTPLGPHQRNPGEWLQRPNEDAGSDTNRRAHRIGQVVDAVREVDLEVPGGTEQGGVTPSGSCEAPTGWLLLVVCLHLDDAPA